MCGNGLLDRKTSNTMWFIIPFLVMKWVTETVLGFFVWMVKEALRPNIPQYKNAV